MARDPKAEIEISAHSRGLGAKLREARAKFSSFGAELRKQVSGKDLSEKGFFGKGGAQLVGNLGSSAVRAVGGMLYDQAKAAYAFDDSLTRLQITSGKTPDFMRAFGSSVRAASNETGIGADQILAASSAYVALTGDIDGAAASSKQWARVAQATNSNVEDIAQTAAALKQNLKISGAEDTEAAFSALAIQGKAGAIEIKDLASQMSTIAPQWAMFKGGAGLSGLRELGAALQVTKQGFGGDAGETITGLQSLLTAMVKNAPKLQKAGIKIFDKDAKTGVKTMRNALEIVQAIGNSKLAKDPTKLAKAFGRVEAYRAYLQLSSNKQLLDELVDKSRDTGAITKDLDTYLNSSAGRIQTSWEGAKNEIQAAFTPERIEMFAKAATTAIQASVGALDAVLTNAERLGKGAAMVVGGKSWDDQVSDIKGKRYEERQRHASAQYDLSHDKSYRSQMGGSDEEQAAYAEQRSRAVETELAMESSFQGRLRTQGAGGTINRTTLDPSPTAQDPLHTTLNQRGNYSVDELAKYQQMFKGSSDEKMTMKLIGDALQRIFADEIAKQTAMLASLVNNGGATKISVDGKVVVDAHKNSREHARKPAR